MFLVLPSDDRKPDETPVPRTMQSDYEKMTENKTLWWEAHSLRGLMPSEDSFNLTFLTFIILYRG